MTKNNFFYGKTRTKKRRGSNIDLLHLTSRDAGIQATGFNHLSTEIL
jgi:hypothetical protein